jgi:hypothetical protein
MKKIIILLFLLTSFLSYGQKVEQTIPVSERKPMTDTIILGQFTISHISLGSFVGKIISNADEIDEGKFKVTYTIISGDPEHFFNLDLNSSIITINEPNLIINSHIDKWILLVELRNIDGYFPVKVIIHNRLYY